MGRSKGTSALLAALLGQDAPTGKKRPDLDALQQQGARKKGKVGDAAATTSNPGELSLDAVRQGNINRVQGITSRLNSHSAAMAAALKEASDQVVAVALEQHSKTSTLVNDASKAMEAARKQHEGALEHLRRLQEELSGDVARNKQAVAAELHKATSSVADGVRQLRQRHTIAA